MVYGGTGKRLVKEVSDSGGTTATTYVLGTEIKTGL